VPAHFSKHPRGHPSGFSRPCSLRPALGPTQPCIQWVPGLFPGGKGTRRGVDHPLHLESRLKKEQNYTSSLLLGPNGRLQGVIYLGPTQPSIQWVPGLFPGGKVTRRGVEHSLHLESRLKKEQNYTSSLLLGPNGRLHGVLYLLLKGPVGVELFLADTEAEGRTDEETKQIN
jgi:hypothetical protein